jgi:hypothetical protein
MLCSNAKVARSYALTDEGRAWFAPTRSLERGNVRAPAAHTPLGVT